MVRPGRSIVVPTSVLDRAVRDRNPDVLARHLEGEGVARREALTSAFQTVARLTEDAPPRTDAPVISATGLARRIQAETGCSLADAQNRAYVIARGHGNNE